MKSKGERAELERQKEVMDDGRGCSTHKLLVKLYSEEKYIEEIYKEENIHRGNKRRGIIQS